MSVLSNVAFVSSKRAELEDSTPWNLLENAVKVSTAPSEYADIAMHRRIQLERMMKLSLWVQHGGQGLA